MAAHDVGKVLNPAGARGQVEGAVVMGIGFALTEEFVPGVTRGFARYRIPTTHDVPEVRAIFVERADPKGPSVSASPGSRPRASVSCKPWPRRARSAGTALVARRPRR